MLLGGSQNTSLNMDFVTIKYNTSGVQQWSTRYNHTSNMEDAPVSVTVSSFGVTVAGAVQTGTTTYRYAVLRYVALTGTFITSSISGGGITGIDIVNDLEEDASGNIYIAGGTPTATEGYNFSVVKLNSSLTLQWEENFNGGDNLDDVANGIKVDSIGNVYVVGYSTSWAQRKDWMVLKYDSTGTSQWEQTYNDTLNGDDEAKSLEIAPTGDLVITGYDSTAINKLDYFTVKYDDNGNEVWNIRADGDAHGNDKALNMAIDTVGDIVITGESQKLDGSYEYKTVKYVERDIVTPKDYNNDTILNSFHYYENKGQLLNTNDTLEPSVRYYTNNIYPSYYIRNNSFSFVFAQVDTLVATIDTLHRIDVAFTNGRPNAKAYPMEEQKEFLNYYKTHIPMVLHKYMEITEWLPQNYTIR
jgi:hypothetical protein